MIKKISIIFLFSFHITISFAQAPFIEWGTTNNNPNILNALENATGITRTTDGGYIMAGAQTSGYPYSRLLNVKMDTKGVLVWNSTFGVPYAVIPGRVRATPDGGCITVVSQEQESSCNIRPTGSSRNFYDMAMYKVSATGTLQWQNCIGSIDQDGGSDIAVLPTGGYIAAGRSTTATGDITSHAGAGDMMLAKIKADGTKIWCKSYGTSDAEQAYGILITSTGACIVAGSKGTDGYVISVDTATGVLNWQATFSGNNTDRINAVSEDNLGNLIFVGTSNSTTGITTTNRGADDFWVLKTTATGTLVWTKTFGSAGPDLGNSVLVETDNTLLVLGTSAAGNNDVPNNFGATDAWLLKLDANGNVIWNKPMGSTGTDGGAGLARATDGGFVTVSSTNALATSFDIKCPAGYLWAAKMGGSGESLPAGATLWLRADRGVNTTGANVNSWADQSTYASNATSVTGLAKPTLITDNIGRYPAIRFAGNDGFTTPALPNFNCKNSSNVFVVLKKQTSALDQTIIESITQPPAGNGSGFILKSNVKTTTCTNCINDNGYMAKHIINATESVNATNGGYSENCYQIVEARFEGVLANDEAQLYVNNVRIGRGGISTTDGNTVGVYESRPLSIGFSTIAGSKTNFFTGDIAEIIVYPNALDARSRKMLYDTLFSKYFSGSRELLNNAVIGNSTTSTGLNFDGRWKHSITTAQPQKAMIAVEDKCNDLATLSSTVYVDANPVYTAANGETFLRRHYTIQATGARKVRLYFTQSEFNDYAAVVSGVNNIKDLGVVKYNGPTEDGVYDLSDATQYASFTNADTGSLYGNKYLEFETNGFSEFWIKSKQIILPLKLLNFSAEKCNENICLNWKTTDEINTQKFELYRSTDGINFKLLNTVNAIGIGNNSYNIINREIQSDVLYYRLKMIDVDGKFTFSNTIKVRSEKDKNIEVFPNPSNNYFSLRGINNVKEIAVVDVTGKVVKTFLPTVSNKYDISNLPATLYFLKIKDNNAEVQIKRLLKISLLFL